MARVSRRKNPDCTYETSIKRVTGLKSEEAVAEYITTNKNWSRITITRKKTVTGKDSFNLNMKTTKIIKKPTAQDIDIF